MKDINNITSLSSQSSSFYRYHTYTVLGVTLKSIQISSRFFSMTHMYVLDVRLTPKQHLCTLEGGGVDGRSGPNAESPDVSDSIPVS